MGMIENPQLKYCELLLMVYLLLAVSVHFFSFGSDDVVARLIILG